MKKMLITLFIAVVCTVLMTGCNGNENNTGTASTPSDKVESPEAVPTLDEVISGTWNLYAGFDQDGNLFYASSENMNVVEYAFTFNANNGFSGVYRESDGYVDSTFTGTYDVTDSKLADKNPYNWYYCATIEKDGITDSGESSLLDRFGEMDSFGEMRINLIFDFRELDGEELLYEQFQGLYFKR